MVAYIGQMGSGKTYSAVKDLLQRLREGHIVVANIRLICRAVTSFLGVPCLLWKRNFYFLGDTDEIRNMYHGLDIYDYESYPCGSPRGCPTFEQDKVYIYWDEASSIFNSLTHVADKTIQAVSAWACHTNKRGQELCVIMQFPTDLNKRIRNHVLFYKASANLGNLRIPILGFRLPKFLGRTIMQSTYANDLSTKITSAMIAILPEVYQCYDTGQIVVGNRVFSATQKEDFSNYILIQQRNDLVIKMFLGSFVSFLILLYLGV